MIYRTRCQWQLAAQLIGVRRERVIARNSTAWGWTYERTAARVDDKDMPNAILVAKTQVHADRVIQSVNDADVCV